MTANFGSLICSATPILRQNLRELTPLWQWADADQLEATAIFLRTSAQTPHAMTHVLDRSQIPPIPASRSGWPWQPESTPAVSFARSSVALPKISIIVPSYNQGRYLEECLRSLLLQNYPALEIHVVDGGSTDNSVEILRKYEPWLASWVSERDSGQSDAINKGFHRCTGEICNWVCSDDLLAPGALHHVAQAFVEQPNTDVIAGSCYCLYETDASRSEIRPSQVDELLQRPYGFAVYQPSCFFKRSLIERSHLVSPQLHYCMDRELWCYLVKRHARWKQLDTCLSTNRFTGGNKSIRGKQKILAELDGIYRAYGCDWIPLTSVLRWIWAPLFRFQRRFNSVPLRAPARVLSSTISLLMRACYPQERVKHLRAEFMMYSR